MSKETRLEFRVSGFIASYITEPSRKASTNGIHERRKKQGKRRGQQGPDEMAGKKKMKEMTNERKKRKRKQRKHVSIQAHVASAKWQD